MKNQKERIEDKIEEIEEYLSRLTEIIPATFEIYKQNSTIKAACERYAEIIIEGFVDLAFLFIKEKKLSVPEDDPQAFDILAKKEIITFDLAKKLKEAKGMRNILAHEYGKIDDELVYHAIAEQLEPDTREFIEQIINK